MKIITVYLPQPYIEALDGLVEKCFYPNRAEAIRAAIRDLIRGDAAFSKYLSDLKTGCGGASG